VYYIFFVEKETLAVLDAALLLENPLLKTICFPVLVVYLTEKEEQVKRILKRNPEMTS
jgi:dephospho-CoA kinase